MQGLHVHMYMYYNVPFHAFFWLQSVELPAPHNYRAQVSLVDTHW